MKRAIYSPTQNFYITRDQAYHMLYNSRSKKNIKKTTKKNVKSLLREDIETALNQRLATHTNEHPWIALDYILSHYEAPRFYISEDYALRLAKNALKLIKHRNPKRP